MAGPRSPRCYASRPHAHGGRRRPRRSRGRVDGVTTATGRRPRPGRPAVAGTCRPGSVVRHWPWRWSWAWPPGSSSARPLARRGAERQHRPPAGGRPARRAAPRRPPAALLPAAARLDAGVRRVRRRRAGAVGHLLRGRAARWPGSPGGAWPGARGPAGRSPWRRCRRSRCGTAPRPACTRWSCCWCSAGYLVLTDALERPTWVRLGGLTLISGLLLLSHYWAFYLLAAVGLLLVAAGVAATGRPGVDGPGDRGGGGRRPALPAVDRRVPLPVGPHRHPVGLAVPADRHRADHPHRHGRRHRHRGVALRQRGAGARAARPVRRAVRGPPASTSTCAPPRRCAGSWRWWSRCSPIGAVVGYATERHVPGPLRRDGRPARAAGGGRGPGPAARARRGSWRAACTWRCRCSASSGSTTSSAPSRPRWPTRWRRGRSPATWWCTAPTSSAPPTRGRCPTASSSSPTRRSSAPDRVDWVDYAERNAAADPPRIAQDDPGRGRRPRRLPRLDDRLHHVRQPVRGPGRPRSA